MCQSIPAYTESNLLNNRDTLAATKANAKQEDLNWFADEPPHFHSTSTISPIYLSRQLNAIPCSIAVCRDDSISILALIELSRRFSNGLWSSIQFWACCGCTLAIINTVCACLALPPVLTPFTVIYLMGVIVPLLSTTLVRVETDSEIMNRATAKKHNSFDSKVFVYAMGAYGCKFLPTIIITVSPTQSPICSALYCSNQFYVLQILSYCTIMSHPVSILSTEINGFYQNLDTSHTFVLYAIVLHFGRWLHIAFDIFVILISISRSLPCSHHFNKFRSSWLLHMAQEPTDQQWMAVDGLYHVSRCEAYHYRMNSYVFFFLSSQTV